MKIAIIHHYQTEWLSVFPPLVSLTARSAAPFSLAFCTRRNHSNQEENQHRPDQSFLSRMWTTALSSSCFICYALTVEKIGAAAGLTDSCTSSSQERQTPSFTLRVRHSNVEEPRILLPWRNTNGTGCSWRNAGSPHRTRSDRLYSYKTILVTAVALPSTQILTWGKHVSFALPLFNGSAAVSKRPRPNPHAARCSNGD